MLRPPGPHLKAHGSAIPKEPEDESDTMVKVDFVTTVDHDIIVLTAICEADRWKACLPRLKKIAATFEHEVSPGST